MVELRLEKKRPVLHTYGIAKGLDDLNSVLGVTASETEGGGGLRKDAQKEDEKHRAEEALLANENKINYYAAVIKEICAQAKVTARTAVASLPVSLVFHAVVTMPVVKKDEFLPILQAEVKKLMARPIEEMALDYQIINGKEKDAKHQKVLVNAVPRVLVAFYSKVFQRAGMILDSLEPESAALSRSLVGRDESVSLIVDMGAERTNFFIVENGVPVTRNSIELGGNKINVSLKSILGVTEAQAEQIKRDLSDYLLSPANHELNAAQYLEIIAPVLNPVTKEIGYALELYLGQSGNANKRPEKIILSGGAALLPFVGDYLSEQFKLKCYVGDPWARVVYQDGLRPVLRQIGPRMAVAIGLALRKVV